MTTDATFWYDTVQSSDEIQRLMERRGRMMVTTNTWTRVTRDEFTHNTGVRTSRGGASLQACVLVLLFAAACERERAVSVGHAVRAEIHSRFATHLMDTCGVKLPSVEVKF